MYYWIKHYQIVYCYYNFLINVNWICNIKNKYINNSNDIYKNIIYIANKYLFSYLLIIKKEINLLKNIIIIIYKNNIIQKKIFLLL